MNNFYFSKFSFHKIHFKEIKNYMREYSFVFKVTLAAKFKRSSRKKIFLKNISLDFI